MKDQAVQIGREYGEEDKNHGRNRLREYLQHLILRELFEQGGLTELVFHGGTALRMIYDLNRFSEDLDFHLSEPDPDYDLTPPLVKLEQRMKKNGYDMTATEPTDGPVMSSFLKYDGLLHEANLSPHTNEKLNIKIEIDANPPSGFGEDASMVSDYFPFSISHHDLPSFLAGKCHAVLQRTYTKGRDYFDLLYYFNKWGEITPNLTYLNNALNQTGYDGAEITGSNWRENLLNRVKQVDWAEVESDVEPFLLRPSDIKAFRKEFLIKVLQEA